MTKIGICGLATANVLSYVLQRHTSLSETVVDPTIGFAYGAAIAATLLGVWRQTRQQRCT